MLHASFTLSLSAALIFALRSIKNVSALCSELPVGHILRTSIRSAPLHSLSSQVIAKLSGSHLHPDFGAGEWEGSPIGIPITYASSSTSAVPIVYTAYGDESDPGPAKIPFDATVEGGPNSDGDRHVLVWNADDCTLWELYRAFPAPNSANPNSWEADSGAFWDLTSFDLRPDGWTSADAAGLPIAPLLVREDEVRNGHIGHALRFTVSQSRGYDYEWPARHYASSRTDMSLPVMGMHFRLRSDYDISGFGAQTRVVLEALKEFGMIVADNGSTGFISGEPSEYWDNDQIVNQLHQVPLSVFEVVDTSSWRVGADSFLAVTASTPTTHPTPKPATPPPTPKPTSASPTLCFPGDSLVEVKEKGFVAMKDVGLGDLVRVAGGRFSLVYTFGHRDQDQEAVFLSLDAGIGKPLLISKDHMLYVNEKFVPASAVSVGDVLNIIEGYATVIKIEAVVARGAFAPFTKDGTIVVDGIVVSSYISLQPNSSYLLIGGVRTFNAHFLAHLFQAPHRLYCEIKPSYCTSENFHNGLSAWVKVPYAVARWLLRQKAFIIALVFIPLFLLVLVAAALERVLASPALLLLSAFLVICSGLFVKTNHLK